MDRSTRMDELKDFLRNEVAHRLEFEVDIDYLVRFTFRVVKYVVRYHGFKIDHDDKESSLLECFRLFHEVIENPPFREWIVSAFENGLPSLNEFVEEENSSEQLK